MSEISLESLAMAVEEMIENQEALSFIESAKENDPIQLFLQLSQIILDESVTEKIVINSIVIMSSILRPTIVHPLETIKNEFQEVDSGMIDSVKQSLFRCLTFSDQRIRLSAARCIGFFAKIELPRRKWHDVFDQLKELVDDTENYGDFAPIGAISSMREILSEVRIWPRWPIFQTASEIVFNSCIDFLSKDIDPDLKIEAVNCLQVAVSLFIKVDQNDTQLYQKILELISVHIPIDDNQLHQQLFTLLYVFLTKIYKILDGELLGQIFEPIISDLTSNDEVRQLHVFLLCKKLAKFEYDQFEGDLSKSHICITEIFERNFDEIFLKIIANCDFSDLNEAESPWVTQHAALKALYAFGKVSPELLFQDCVSFYETYESSEDSTILLSSLCAVQVITSIQTEEAVSFIDSNIESILELCDSEDSLVRSAAFSVIKSALIDKKEVLYSDEHYDTILQIVKFGIESDFLTARLALQLFKSLCSRFEFEDKESNFLSDNLALIMEILQAAEERQDALEGQFIEEVSDAIFVYIQHLPKIESIQAELVEILKKILNQFNDPNSTGIDERIKSADFETIIAIVQSLEYQIIPYEEMLLNTLLQEYSSLCNENSNEVSNIMLTISQVVFYVEQVDQPYLDQIVSIVENAQLSNSPSNVNASALLIGVLISKMGCSLFDLGQQGISIVQRLFQLVYQNLEKVETLESSIPHLLFALADIINGVTGGEPEKAENAQQFISPVMEICNGYVENLEYFVNSDFDAANSIADALMNLFTVIIGTFPTDIDFISNNLKHVFIQVPIVVWNHRMLTKRTIKYFLMLMNQLVRKVGRQNNIELNNQKLREFLKFANDPNSPYVDLIPLAHTVSKFYSDI